jgi:hypothetical protein
MADAWPLQSKSKACRMMCRASSPRTYVGGAVSSQEPLEPQVLSVTL